MERSSLSTRSTITPLDLDLWPVGLLDKHVLGTKTIFTDLVKSDNEASEKPWSEVEQQRFIWKVIFVISYFHYGLFTC